MNKVKIHKIKGKIHLETVFNFKTIIKIGINIVFSIAISRYAFVQNISVLNFKQKATRYDSPQKPTSVRSSNSPPYCEANCIETYT